MTKINDGGQAFPIQGSSEPGALYPDPGMSLRDWFAGQIASGMAAFSGTAGGSYGPYEIAGRSYQIADALIAARRAEKPE